MINITDSYTDFYKAKGLTPADVLNLVHQSKAEISNLKNIVFTSIALSILSTIIIAILYILKQKCNCRMTQKHTENIKFSALKTKAFTNYTPVDRSTRRISIKK